MGNWPPKDTRKRENLLQTCNGLTSKSFKIPPSLPGSPWYSLTLFRFPCLGRCFNIENEGEIKPKVTVEKLRLCKSFLLARSLFFLFFSFSGDDFYLALAVFWKQCIQNNLSLFGTFVLVKLACYLVSWRSAIPTDGQEYRQPGDHVQASVCVLRARSLARSVEMIVCPVLLCLWIRWCTSPEWN